MIRKLFITPKKFNQNQSKIDRKKPIKFKVSQKHKFQRLPCPFYSIATGARQRFSVPHAAMYTTLATKMARWLPERHWAKSPSHSASDFGFGGGGKPPANSNRLVRMFSKQWPVGRMPADPLRRILFLDLSAFIAFYLEDLYHQDE